MAKTTLELKLPDWAKAQSGYGSGYGSGSGSGSGVFNFARRDFDGYGSGSGYGYGYGSGDGSGDGDGDGYGSGYGDGDGDGYGSGYGDGSGDGDGYEKNRLIYFAALLAPYDRSKDRRVMFWRSRADGFPANGGKPKTKARIGITEEVEGPLRLCSVNALHGTMDPASWEGERWWIVALHEPVRHDGNKSGSLKRTIVAALGKCPF